MNFPHYVVVTRTGPGANTPGGVQDPDEGTWTDDPALPDKALVTKGRADVQDVGTVVQRDEAGMPTLTSDATCFFRTESKVKLCKDGDTVLIHWNDGQPDSTARIVKIRRLDGTLMLSRV